MPRSSDKTLQAVHDAGFRLFFRRGYARVSMDDIAAAAGVTKRTLYYHFESKDALIGSVLSRQADLSLAEIRKWADPDARTARGFLDGLFQKLAAWAAQPGWTGPGFTRLTLELGDLPGHPVRKAASLHKTAIETWIATELRDRGRPSSTAEAVACVILMEGGLILCLLHGDVRYLEEARETALKLVSDQI